MIRRILSVICLLLIKKNQFESVLLRKLYQKLYGINVGMYSYGCFDYKRFPKGIVIGRYCSFAPSAYVFGRNHGVEFLSLHPYLYNASLGIIKHDTIQLQPCVIEDDVWLGHNSTILPSVKVVGRGAVVAAGAVVTTDVPRYAIVAGIPAKIVKYRFEEDIINRIENSQWWTQSKDSLQHLAENNKDFVFNTRNSNANN
jgi:virginiamycin A acetyltransferase